MFQKISSLDTIWDNRGGPPFSVVIFLSHSAEEIRRGPFSV